MIHIQNDFLNFFLKFITTIGSNYGIFLILTLYLFISKNEKKLNFLKNSMYVLIFNNFLKILFQRQRPIEMVIEENFFSFPSGHAMASTFVLGYIIMEIYDMEIKKNLKIFLISFLSLIIFLICFSRVYFMVHYFSDVLFGFLISLILLILISMHRN